MDSDRPSRRLYNEKEVGALIQRATEIHQASEHGPDRNLSIEDVERVAEELGLPRELVRQAAREMEAQTPPRRLHRILGGPFKVSQVRVTGRPLSDEAWEHVVDALRAHTGSAGQTATVGTSREWTRTIQDAGIPIEQTHVTVRPEGDQTSIRLQKRYGGGASFAYTVSFLLGVTVAGAILDGGSLSDLANFAIAGGSGVGALGVTRVSLSVWARRQQDRLRALADRLELALAGPSREAPAQLTSALQASAKLAEPARSAELLQADEPEGVPLEQPRRERA